ncbi:hypothetical protein [Mycolicibacterium sp.]|uniref:hypothetical protein n=1 Tax=Mycolicibacterium sp. TaxID=2320850 RepID=UPI00355E9856
MSDVQAQIIDVLKFVGIEVTEGSEVVFDDAGQGPRRACHVPAGRRCTLRPQPRRAAAPGPSGTGSSVGAGIRTENVSHAVATITVPAKDARTYLEEVLRQVDSGFTSGHVDRDTNWDAKFDAGDRDWYEQ